MNNEPDYQDNLFFEPKDSKSDIKLLCELLIEKYPEMKDWVILHYGYLFEGDIK